ncbi:ATP-binding cassette domain-containing protein [Micrococcales bacterium 31B]|nr:ATP-binding cassette domain-containing protein [Micrococcales bacterium 31B]
MIRFEKVTKTYRGGVTAVDNLNLTIDRGTFTVFVGPSGCGKTTSMRMINAMVKPTRGTVYVDGDDVSRVNAVNLRRHIGYVIQSAGLMPHRRVVDNIATVPVLLGTPKRQARLQALEVMERVGLDLDLAQRFPAELSGGQQQRVGVARALASDPPILLMDEPFSAVDPIVREELQLEMQRLQAELHKTIVFVTHDIDEAMLLGDQVAVFGVGGLLQQVGSPESLLTNPATPAVTEIVGRDRGYRGLQFRHSGTLSLDEIDTVQIDRSKPVLPALEAADGWRLLVDRADKPIGWIDHRSVAAFNGGTSLEDSLAVGGSLFVRGATLRQALDAGLSSPAGVGVAVDEAGTVVGGVRPDTVLAALSQQRSALRERSTGPR